DLAVVELDLGVETADALVVEAEQVALLAADRDRRGQLTEDPAFVDSFEHLKGYDRHRPHPPRRPTIPRSVRRSPRTPPGTDARARSTVPRGPSPSSRGPDALLDL